MFTTQNNSSPDNAASLTPENKEMLDRINAFANEVMGGIDPQKTQISVQLEKLRPIMEEIAGERGISLEDIFILYMDLASQAAIAHEQKLQDIINFSQE